MTTADVTFVIDANDAGLVQAARRSVRSLREIEGAFDDLRKSARAGDNEVRRFAAGADDINLGPAEQSAKKFTLSADNLGKTLSFLSPRLGEVSAKAASLGMAGGPMLAAAAGMLAAVSAGVALGRMALDTAQNIDELTASLSEADRIGVQASIKSLEEQKVRLDDAADGWTQLKIVVSAAVGGPLTDYLYIAGNIAEATAEASDETDTWLVDLVTLPARLATPLFVLEKYADLLGMVADAQREAEGSKFESEFDAQAGRGFDFAGDNGGTFGGDGFNVIAAGRPGSVTPATPRRNTASNRPPSAGPTWLETFGEFDASLANLRTGIEAELDDLSVRAVDVWIGPEVQAALQARDELSEEYHLREMERIAERRRADHEALTTSLSLASNTIGAMGDLWGTLAEAAGASAREVWGIQKAAAVAQAALAIPLAVLEGLKSGGPAAPALAAVYGALAAIQFATVAATPPPKFHSGGILAPDEETITVRTNERLAVLTSQGADSVARMNAGRPAAQPVAEYFFIDRYGMRRAERFARPRPELAVARRGGW